MVTTPLLSRTTGRPKRQLTKWRLVISSRNISRKIRRYIRETNHYSIVKVDIRTNKPLNVLVRLRLSFSVSLMDWQQTRYIDRDWSFRSQILRRQKLRLDGFEPQLNVLESIIPSGYSKYLIYIVWLCRIRPELRVYKEVWTHLAKTN